MRESGTRVLSERDAEMKAARERSNLFPCSCRLRVRRGRGESWILLRIRRTRGGRENAGEMRKCCRGKDRLIAHRTLPLSLSLRLSFLSLPLFIQSAIRERRITSSADLSPSLTVPSDKDHKSECITAARESEGEGDGGERGTSSPVLIPAHPISIMCPCQPSS